MPFALVPLTFIWGLCLGRVCKGASASCQASWVEFTFVIIAGAAIVWGLEFAGKVSVRRGFVIFCTVLNVLLIFALSIVFVFTYFAGP